MTIPVGLKVAVVLSGCGHLDGSDITETVSMLIHLSKHKAETSVFAPFKQQYETINHFTKKRSDDESRNMLDEACRFRPSVFPLSDRLNPAAFDVLMFPGGEGVMKNLSNFGVLFGADGKARDILPAVHKVLVAFHAARKPIGVAGTAPILVAKVVKGATITFGAVQGEAADLARTFGAVVVASGRTEVVVDPLHRVASTAAYMFEDATPAEVFDAMGSLVESTFLLQRWKSQEPKPTCDAVFMNPRVCALLVKRLENHAKTANAQLERFNKKEVESNTIDNLKKRQSEIKAFKKTLEDEKNARKVKIVSIETDIVDLKARVAAVEEEQATKVKLRALHLTTLINHMNANAANANVPQALNTLLTALEQEISSLDRRISSLSEQILANVSRISTLEQDDIEANKRIFTLWQQIFTLGEKMA